MLSASMQGLLASDSGEGHNLDCWSQHPCISMYSKNALISPIPGGSYKLENLLIGLISVRSIFAGLVDLHFLCQSSFNINRMDNIAHVNFLRGLFGAPVELFDPNGTTIIGCNGCDSYKR